MENSQGQLAKRSRSYGWELPAKIPTWNFRTPIQPVDTDFPESDITLVCELPPEKSIYVPTMQTKRLRFNSDSTDSSSDINPANSNSTSWTKLYTHRFMLAWASPVFKRMLSPNSGFIESQNSEIKLPGKKADDVEEFLRAIFPMAQFNPNFATAARILPLAIEYQVEPIKQRCFSALVKSLHPISRDAAATCYYLGYTFDVEPLLRQSEDYLVKLESSQFDAALEVLDSTPLSQEGRQDLMSKRLKYLHEVENPSLRKLILDMIQKMNYVDISLKELDGHAQICRDGPCWDCSPCYIKERLEALCTNARSNNASWKALADSIESPFIKQCVADMVKSSMH